MENKTIYQFLTDLLPKTKVAVIGDIMLDRYIFGSVNRISPESPVPVNLVKEIKEVLGGAANVANNLANLDTEVYIAGSIGRDSHGKNLEKLLQTEGIHTEGLYVDEERPTTTKTRILGERQQMMRLDFEEVKPCKAQEVAFYVNWLDKLIAEGLQGLVISDYGKGICTDELLAAILQRTKEHGIFTIVDPKGSNWSKYDGASCITPNVKELGEAVGRELANRDEDIIEAAKEVLSKVDLDYIVGTRSAKGITVVTKDHRVWHSAATQQDVFDVSGAGDTVVSMIVTAFTNGLTMRASLLVANAAAGVVVSKVGTYPIHREELLELWNVSRRRKETSPLIWEREELGAQIKAWRKAGEKVVFTNGCFDILHRGHLSYLEEASKLGDHLIVALNSDASVKRLKGESRPINNELDRAYMMSSLEWVDGVVLFEEDTPWELLNVLRPHILVKGGDYEIDSIVGRELVDEVKVLPFKEGYSTTNIIEKIKALVKEGKV